MLETCGAMSRLPPLQKCTALLFTIVLLMASEGYVSQYLSIRSINSIIIAIFPLPVLIKFFNKPNEVTMLSLGPISPDLCPSLGCV
jgi:hypothetical protein